MKYQRSGTRCVLPPNGFPLPVLCRQQRGHEISHGLQQFCSLHHATVQYALGPSLFFCQENGGGEVAIRLHCLYCLNYAEVKPFLYTAQCAQMEHIHCIDH